MRRRGVSHRRRLESAALAGTVAAIRHLSGARFQAHSYAVKARSVAPGAGRNAERGPAKGEGLTSGALAQLAERMYPQLVRFMARELGQAEAEGAAQDVLERAVAHRTSFEGDRGTPEGWLWGIAQSVKCDRLTALDHQQQILALMAAALSREGVADVETIVVGQELAQLGPVDRRIIELRFWHNLTIGAGSSRSGGMP